MSAPSTNQGAWHRNPSIRVGDERRWSIDPGHWVVRHISGEVEGKGGEEGKDSVIGVYQGVKVRTNLSTDSARVATGLGADSALCFWRSGSLVGCGGSDYGGWRLWGDGH